MKTLNQEDFARLFAEHHRRIFGFIRSMLPQGADADEVFQETCVVLWREFTSYDPSRPFAPWALAIARNQVRSHNHRHRRDRLVFSDALVDELSVEEDRMAKELNSRGDALSGCLSELSAADQELVSRCYADVDAAERGKQTIRAAAESLGRPTNTVYKALRRIRSALAQCIERRIAAEDRGGRV